MILFKITHATHSSSTAQYNHLEKWIGSQLPHYETSGYDVTCQMVVTLVLQLINVLCHHLRPTLHLIINAFIWVWKLHIPKNIRLLHCLVLHKSLPTNSLRHHRNMSSSPMCNDYSQHGFDNGDSIIVLMRTTRKLAKSWEKNLRALWYHLILAWQGYKGSILFAFSLLVFS